MFSQAAMAERPETAETALPASADVVLVRLQTARAAWEAREARERSDETDVANLTGVPAPPPASPIVLAPQSRASYRLCRAREDEIRRVERTGRFTCLPLAVGCEYPTLLTRLPIFRPSRRVSQIKALNNRGGIVFDSPWGSGVRKGPPVTVFDESVLMALLRLRTYQLTGRGEALPLAIRSNDTGYRHVHYAICTASQIVRELGLARGGKQYRTVTDSVKDLAAVTIELEDRVRARYVGATESGSSIRLFELRWDTHADDSVLEVQFSPAMSRWLGADRTFVDPLVREALGSDLAKALHRFLSSQSAYYRTTLERCCDAVGFDGVARNARTKFGAAFDELRRQGWLAHVEFSGTGRLDPISVETLRAI